MPPGGEFITKQSPDLLPLLNIPHPLKRENAFYINKGIENAPLNSLSFLVFCRFMHDISIKFDNGKWTTGLRRSQLIPVSSRQKMTFSLMTPSF